MSLASNSDSECKPSPGDSIPISGRGWDRKEGRYHSRRWSGSLYKIVILCKCKIIGNRIIFSLYYRKKNYREFLALARTLFSIFLYVCTCTCPSSVCTNVDVDVHRRTRVFLYMEYLKISDRANRETHEEEDTTAPDHGP